MHEAQVLPQILAELSQVAERDAMPETAATPAPEQSFAHHARNRAIRRSVVRDLQPRGLDDPKALESPRPSSLRVGRNARIGPGVDQDPAGCENPMYLAQGMDHALSRDSSKCPREDHHIEGRIWIRQVLSCAGAEANVSNTGLARVSLRGSDGLRVGINPFNACSKRRDSEGQTAVAAPEVQDPLPAH
jgi:hypothetical protein